MACSLGYLQGIVIVESSTLEYSTLQDLLRSVRSTQMSECSVSMHHIPASAVRWDRLRGWDRASESVTSTRHEGPERAALRTCNFQRVQRAFILPLPLKTSTPRKIPLGLPRWPLATIRLPGDSKSRGPGLPARPAWPSLKSESGVSQWQW
jgi:hypothetical protein